MVYSKQSWSDTAAGGTPITAARLNHMEAGIEEAAETADSAVAQQYVDNADAALSARIDALDNGGNPFVVIGPTDEIPLGTPAGSLIVRTGGFTPPPDPVNPEVVTSSILNFGSQAANNLTVTKPSGMQDGDLLVAAVTSQNGATTGTWPPVLPSGWVLLRAPHGGQPADDGGSAAAFRSTVLACLPVPSAAALTGSEWNFALGTGTGRMAALTFRVTGVDLDSPLLAFSPTTKTDIEPHTTASYPAATGLSLFIGNGQVSAPNPGWSQVTGAIKVVEAHSTGSTTVDNTTVTRTVLTLATTAPVDGTQGAVIYSAPDWAARAGFVVTLRPRA